MTLTASGPRPLERVSSVDAVHKELRRRILDGDLKPGTRLREVELARTYGVGRYTLRAALRELVHRGMAVHGPNRGVAVLTPTAEIIGEVYAVRAALECEAARLTVEQGSDLGDVRDAVSYLAGLPKHATWHQLLEADLAVHEAIVRAAGRERLLEAFLAIADQVLLCLSTLGPLGHPYSQVAEEHRALLAGLEGADPNEAAARLRAHLYEIVAAVAGSMGR